MKETGADSTQPDARQRTDRARVRTGAQRGIHRATARVHDGVTIPVPLVRHASLAHAAVESDGIDLASRDGRRSTGIMG